MRWGSCQDGEHPGEGMGSWTCPVTLQSHLAGEEAELGRGLPWRHQPSRLPPTSMPGEAQEKAPCSRMPRHEPRWGHKQSLRVAASPAFFFKLFDSI